MARLALYGNVGIVRVFCQECQRSALVVKGVRQCCDRLIVEDVTGSERIIEPEAIRRTPTGKECHVCNHWKSDKVFNYLEEVQVYVAEKWERVKTDVGKALPSMRSDVPD